jgi:peptide/nickel transport system permease protein
VQYFDWLWRALQGDFGDSYFFKTSVARLIMERMPITMTLGLCGLAIALCVALPLGILAAVRENTWVDRSVLMVALIGQAMPSFWLGLTLMIVLGLNLGWLPISGTGSWEHYVMPSIVLSFSAIPSLMRLTRSGMIEALASDYIRTARAKGLGRSRVVLRHAVPNALAPIINVVALNLAYLITGVVVVEVVFVYPGLGQLMIDAVTNRDIPVVQAITLIFASAYVLLNLIADVLSTITNPRLMHRK